MSEEKKAYPFALVGFFITDKEVGDAFRTDTTPDELEQLQELLKKLIFVEGVDITITPFVVPPDQVDNALKQLAEVVFTPREGEEN